MGYSNHCYCKLHVSVIVEINIIMHFYDCNVSDHNFQKSPNSICCECSCLIIGLKPQSSTRGLLEIAFEYL